MPMLDTTDSQVIQTLNQALDGYEGDELELMTLFMGVAAGEIDDVDEVVRLAREALFQANREEDRLLGNVFCPTGEGGGIDPTCSKGVKGSTGLAGLDMTFGGHGEFMARYSGVHNRLAAKGEEGEAVQQYTQGKGFAERVNRSMGQGKKLKPEDAAAVQTIKDVIQSTPPLAESIVVFRNTERPMKVGDTFSEKGFTSTTSDSSTSFLFSGTPTAIEIPAGARVLPIPKTLNGKPAKYSGEKEVLIPPGARFEVVGTTDVYTRGEGFHLRMVLDDHVQNAAPSVEAGAEALYDISDEYTRREAREIARAVKVGYVRGHQVETVARRIMRTVGVDQAKALVLAVTETTRFAAADALREARASGAKRVRFRIGDEACEICQGLDGQTFNLKQADRILPVHPHCNCRWETVED